jgi:membrane fusion protein (multidrug efflux system)
MSRFIIISILLCIFSAGCGKKEKQVPVPPSVTVVPAVMGNVVSATEIIGQAKAYDEVDLVARVQGFLTKINFQEGTTVTKGQLLFQIEKDQYQALVESAQAMLMKAQAVFDNAEITYNRQKKLFEENATAKKNLDDAISANTEAKANVMQAEADLTTAKLNLGYTTINAPFDGRIGFYTYSEGNLVGLSSKRLANVVKLDPMRVQFNISEVDLVNLQLNRLKENAAVKGEYVVTVQFQNGALYSQEGKLSFADNKVNSSTGTILVEALFPNPDQVLVPGMYVKVAVKDKEQKPALLIPQSSIQESQLGKFVLVVGADNKVLQRVIKTGIKSGPSIQVVEGLKEGERVVVEGLQKVRLGMPVKPLVDESYSFNSPEPVKKPEVK